jgi:hypothetical protein
MTTRKRFTIGFILGTALGTLAVCDTTPLGPIKICPPGGCPPPCTPCVNGCTVDGACK